MHIFFDDVGVIHWNWMRRVIATPRNRNEHMRPGVPLPNTTHSTPPRSVVFLAARNNSVTAVVVGGLLPNRASAPAPAGEGIKR